MAFLFSTVGLNIPRSRRNQLPRTTSTSNRPLGTFLRTKRAMLMTNTVVEKGAGMRIIKAADEETISKLGCRSWDKWSCEPSTFQWSYSDDELCLVLEGDFTVVPDQAGEPMGKYL